MIIQLLYFLQLPIGSRNPDDNSPIDITNPFDLIVYVILPILMIIFYIIWRRGKNKRGKD
ncbi:MAG: adenylosuccinate synthetase [Aquaticitalea sp.]